MKRWELLIPAGFLVSVGVAIGVAIGLILSQSKPPVYVAPPTEPKVVKADPPKEAPKAKTTAVDPDTIRLGQEQWGRWPKSIQQQVTAAAESFAKNGVNGMTDAEVCMLCLWAIGRAKLRDAMADASPERAAFIRKTITDLEKNGI